MAETEELGLEVFVQGWQQFQNILDKLDKGIDGLDKTASSASKGGLSAFAVAAGTLAANAVMALGRELVKVGGAVVDFTADSISMAADFESSMAVLSVAASSSGLAMDELKAATLAVGGDTRLLGVSATGAAESITGLYKAGLSTTAVFGDFNAYLEEGAELGGALRAAIDLAAATELDMVQASDLAAIALSSFGGEMETDAERAEFINTAMNNMVMAADASVAEVSDLAESLKMVGPTAGAAGISIQDVNNALALLSTRGISGSMAGTALDGMLRSLRDTTPQAQKELDKLGISIFDASGEMLPMVDIIGQFETSLADATDAEKAMALGTIFTAQGQRAMNTLLTTGVDGWNDMADATANAATIQEQAAVRGQTFEAQMESLDGVIETLKIQIGDAFLPIAKELAGWFSEVVEQHGPAITAAFQAVAEAILPFIQYIAFLLIEGDALNDFLTQLPEPIQAFVLMVQENLPLVQAAFAEVFGFIQELVGTVIAWFQENLPLITTEGNKMIEAWLAIKESFNEIWEIIKIIVSTTLETILGIIRAAMQIAQGDWSGAWDTIKGILINIAAALLGITENLFEAIANVMGTTMEEIRATWASIWEMIKVILIDTLNTAATTVSQAMEIISTVISTTMENVRAAWASIWDNVVIIVTTTWENIKTAIAQGLVNAVNLIRAKIEAFHSVGADLMEGLRNGIMSKVQSIVNAAKEAVERAINAAKRVLGIGSPSRVFADIGKQTMEGLVVGMDKLIPQVQATMVAAVTPPRAAMVSPTAMAGTQIVNNVTNTDARQFTLNAQTQMQPGQLALEFSTFSMATR